MSSQADNQVQPSANKDMKVESQNHSSDSSKFDDYIGSGGFGKVYEIKGTNLVKKEMDLRHEENIREICFLSTYKHIPFITQINKCEIDTVKNTINLFMEYAGLSLRDLSKTLNIEQRIKLVPTLMVQFARIMIWMKQEKILHCDVKPANICIDDELNVKMIDWGFVQKFIPSKKYKIGTQVFYDPYTHCDKINHSSEMFAFGITICYFVMCGFDYDEWEDFCYVFDDKDTSTLKTNVDKVLDLNDEALLIIDIEKTQQNFIDVFGNLNYYETLLEMIHIDEDCRIDMVDLYNECPISLRLKYPLSECYTHIHDNLIIISRLPDFQEKISTKIIGMIVDWMINLKFTFKIKYSLFNAIQLLFRYLKSVKIDVSEIPSIATICLYISSMMNSENILDIERCTKICELKTKSEIIKLQNKVLTALNFEVYPETENIEYNKKDDDLWRSVFLKSYDKTHLFVLPTISQLNFDKIYNENKNKKKHGKKVI